MAYLTTIYSLSSYGSPWHLKSINFGKLKLRRQNLKRSQQNYLLLPLMAADILCICSFCLASILIGVINSPICILYTPGSCCRVLEMWFGNPFLKVIFTVFLRPFSINLTIFQILLVYTPTDSPDLTTPFNNDQRWHSQKVHFLQFNHICITLLHFCYPEI